MLTELENNAAMMNALRLDGTERVDAVRYFSLARYALAAGLKALGVGQGHTVLLPEYICRDLIAAVHKVGATPVYYPVDLNLCPASSSELWPDAAVVLAVDYFGFPQPLQCFREYCARTGALLIEDNAHGFLSRDEEGALLGFRGDVGLLSLRKTFMLPNGAALIVPSTHVVKHLEPQEAFADQRGSLALRLKSAFRRLPVLGPSIVAGVTGLVRGVRQLRTGHAIPPPAENAEIVIPGSPLPYSELLSDLAQFDFSAEVARRRSLYAEFSTTLRQWNIEPVYPSLPEHVSPYGYPFRATDADALKIKKLAERQGFDAFRWPDLPDFLASTSPDHYCRTWVLNFLW
jgi:hypothetical protein